MIKQRCAIYTRKSTEEGLEQNFNSLDAQREACAAYVLSQKHEGWSGLADRYDDGGFSGGSMERPGLKQLLADVRAGRVDVIVVYKVDRLTRSLTDFAKMVEAFDEAGVSFVSVTQAFNTTNSMGRLTLNVLLSFAQFEREVTAERIRDKVAASKRKGMWMGGAVPMGYEVRDKALVVNPDEAHSIRTIYNEYLATGSVRSLARTLSERGIVSKRRTDRHGRITGGKALSRGALYNILRNPTYVGKVRHKDALYDGLHQAIVDSDIWRQVQTQLAGHGGKKISGNRKPAKRLLDGRLFDEHGRAMGTTYASKGHATNGSHHTKRYWYYASKKVDTDDTKGVRRLPASELEDTVQSNVWDKLRDHDWLADQFRQQDATTSLIAKVLAATHSLPTGSPQACGSEKSDKSLPLIQRIDLVPGALRITLDLAPLTQPVNADDTVTIRFDVPFILHQKGRAKPIIITTEEAPVRQDVDLIGLITDAKRWMEELLNNEVASVQEITEREHLRSGSVSRILPLAFLAPDITSAIVNGTQPASLSAKSLRDLKDLPLDWSQQRRTLGFPVL
ncbi:MAG: recombinase family protein [Pseudomonadota bacterium]